MAAPLSFQSVSPLLPSTPPLQTATNAKLRPPERFSPPYDRNSYAPVRCISMAAGHMLARRFGPPLLNKFLSSRRAITTHRFPRPRTVAQAAWKQEVLWAEAPLVEVEKAAETLYHVALDISDNPELMAGHTTPGQFVQVRVGDSKPAFLAIASPPATSSGGSLEFLIKYVEGSTAGLLCDLRKGDTVELSQVLGNGFDIKQISPPEKYSTVFLFATGSGISPIRSLLESGLEASKRSDVTLYYGARNLQRMAYQERFKEWESSGLKIVPVLSQPDDDWTGERGYVQEAFARVKRIQNPLASGAVLCGHKGMAEDVTSLLSSDGILKEKILKNF